MKDNLAFMLLALEQSTLALPYCRPNPPVGCVVVHQGQVVAQGFTQPPGNHHAEMLHLTGRFNYQQMGRKIGVNLVDKPNLVSTEFNIAVRTACEYWTMKSYNLAADRDNFDAVMTKINGGTTNGRQERLDALNRAKKYLGIS